MASITMAYLFSTKQYLISKGIGFSRGRPTTNKNRKRGAEEESAYGNSKLLIVLTIFSNQCVAHARGYHTYTGRNTESG